MWTDPGKSSTFLCERPLYCLCDGEGQGWWGRGFSHSFPTTNRLTPRPCLHGEVTRDSFFPLHLPLAVLHCFLIHVFSVLVSVCELIDWIQIFIAPHGGIIMIINCFIFKRHCWMHFIISQWCVLPLSST